MRYQLNNKRHNFIKDSKFLTSKFFFFLLTKNCFVSFQFIILYKAIEITNEKVNKPNEMEAIATRPLQYVIGLDNSKRSFLLDLILIFRMTITSTSLLNSLCLLNYDFRLKIFNLLYYIIFIIYLFYFFCLTKINL